MNLSFEQTPGKKVVETMSEKQVLILFKKVADVFYKHLEVDCEGVKWWGKINPTGIFKIISTFIQNLNTIIQDLIDNFKDIYNKNELCVWVRSNFIPICE